MATRQEIDYVLGRWGAKPENEWPRKYAHPRNEHDFLIGVSLVLQRQRPEQWGVTIYPTYNEYDEVTGFQGIRFKGRDQWQLTGPGGVDKFIRDTLM